MASGFFAVLDDITVLMDDVAVATKLAARKTAGILGDDLAVNAEKATGFMASRELPVLWAITKGSLLNKLIIVPVALLLNAFLPSVITYILLLGGCYLAYEGAEKIVHYLLHRKKTGHEVIEVAVQNGPEDEKVKVRSAVITDFILSVEIVIIALGSVAAETTSIQVITVSAVALLATIGVYGLVALLVRMDDAGLRLIQTSGDKGAVAFLGHGLVKALPLLIRILAIGGTIALLLVSGGIFEHNLPILHHLFLSLPSIIRELVFGLAAGLVIVACISMFKRLFTRKK